MFSAIDKRLRENLFGDGKAICLNYRSCTGTLGRMGQDIRANKDRVNALEDRINRLEQLVEKLQKKKRR